MREYRGDGGREGGSKGEEFRVVDWKLAAERGGGDSSSNSNNSHNGHGHGHSHSHGHGHNLSHSHSMRPSERKDARERDHQHQHRGGGEGRESMSGRRDPRSSGGGVEVGANSVGGDNTINITSGSRDRKTEDLRLSSGGGGSSIPQESGDLRDSWGGRSFLKSSSSNSAQGQGAAAIAAGNWPAVGAPNAVGQEADAGPAVDLGGNGGGSGGGEATTMAPTTITSTRFEEGKRKRDERGGESKGVSSNSNVSNIHNSGTEKEERQHQHRDKSERRGAGVGSDLQVHIPLSAVAAAAASQQRPTGRDKDHRDEKAAGTGKERERDKEESTSGKQQHNKEEEDKDIEKKEDEKQEKEKKEKERQEKEKHDREKQEKEREKQETEKLEKEKLEKEKREKKEKEDKERREKEKEKQEKEKERQDKEKHKQEAEKHEKEKLEREKERKEKERKEKEKEEKEKEKKEKVKEKLKEKEKGKEREVEKEHDKENEKKEKDEGKTLKEKDEPVAKVKAAATGAAASFKESEAHGRREERDVGHNNGSRNQRKEAVDLEERDPASTAERDGERRGGLGVGGRGGSLSPIRDFDNESSAAGDSVVGGNAHQEEVVSKTGAAAETELKDGMGAGAGLGLQGERKEQQQLMHYEKGKGELQEVDEPPPPPEKGKRKLRDYDRAGGGGGVLGGDEIINANNAEAEDYEKEVVSNYIQRKRLLRPRGHYQGSSTREVRPRFRVKDPDTYSNRGTSGAPPVAAPASASAAAAAESSALVYRSGEGLQEELRRIRKDFDDRIGRLTPEQQQQQPLQSLQVGAPTIEVRVPAELATGSNRQVQGSQLWGTDIYTDDSDLVAVLMHTGYYAPTASSPPPGVSELRATVRVLPPQERYTSTQRNALRSRAWGTASGCAFSVESCYLLKKDGGRIQLEPRLTSGAQAFAPTLSPTVTERTVTTRAISMNTYRAQRFVQEVTIQYNLCNEPWLKYNMNIIADKGLKKSQYTSARLKKNDVLYVETHFQRYELSYEDSKSGTSSQADGKATVLEKGKEKAEPIDKGTATDKGTEKAMQQAGNSKSGAEKAAGGAAPAPPPAAGGGGNNQPNDSVVTDKFRWALCKWPLPLQSMRAKGVPLSLEFVKVVEQGLGWEEVQWSPAGVCVRGKEYPLARAHFVPLHE